MTDLLAQILNVRDFHWIRVKRGSIDLVELASQLQPHGITVVPIEADETIDSWRPLFDLLDRKLTLGGSAHYNWNALNDVIGDRDYWMDESLFGENGYVIVFSGLETLSRTDPESYQFLQEVLVGSAPGEINAQGRFSKALELV